VTAVLELTATRIEANHRLPAARPVLEWLAHILLRPFAIDRPRLHADTRRYRTQGPRLVLADALGHLAHALVRLAFGPVIDLIDRDRDLSRLILAHAAGWGLVTGLSVALLVGGVR
jgi:hypothetical protein